MNLNSLILKFILNFTICEGAVKIDELAQYCKKIKLKQLVCAIVIIYVVL